MKTTEEKINNLLEKHGIKNDKLKDELVALVFLETNTAQGSRFDECQSGLNEYYDGNMPL